MSDNPLVLFAVSAPGLEPYTHQELVGLKLALASTGSTAPIQGEASADESGGVAFQGDLQALYQANLQLRTASRVLVRMGDFYAVGFDELRKKARRLPWERFLGPGRAAALRVSCHRSKLYHSDAVAERVLAAIGDRLGRPVALEKFDDRGDNLQPQLFVVRLLHDHCEISADSSGPLLHRRGYRQAVAKAPLRETLAAGLLLASGWDGTAPLLDPFCGSGTIPIEAALLARGLPPGRNRCFAFMQWPGFQPELWEQLLAARQAVAETGGPLIQGSDRDAGAIRMSEANAERAGVAQWIDFACRAVSAVEPQGKGWVVTNPPYGLRVSANKDLRNLYAQLGKVLRARCPGWQFAILGGDLQLLRATGLQFDAGLALVNGGVAVRLARGVVPV